MKEIVFDAGALIALERGDREIRAYIFLAERGRVTLTTSSAVVAQVWRGGARPVRLARFVSSDLMTEIALDADMSRRVGNLAATVGASDVVDGHVAVIALERDAVVITSDPRDIALWGVDGRRIIAC